MEIYNVENLSFTYPHSEKSAVDDVSFKVNAGEFVTICGISGSGKSTLLRQLKTCIKPYGIEKGKVFFMGKAIDDVGEREQAKKIGFVMQSAENQSITNKVWHELSFGLESMGIDSENIKKRTAEISAFFGIEKWYEKSIDELSGGQKQILNLAAVMVMQPSVLILDEPTAQLDPIAAEEFISMLRKINSTLGTTVIISEHNLDEVFSISSRIIVMSEGKIIVDNNPQKIAEMLFSQKHKMFCALPSASKIYCLSGESGNCPIDTAGGRKWLFEYSKNINLRALKADEEKIQKNKPIIEMKNVFFRYDKKENDILFDVNLKIYGGEIFTILGGNGAGKTTLLTVMAGINKPYSGKMVFEKENNKEINIAYMPQNPKALFIKSTVEEDLYDVFSDKNIEKEEIDISVKRAVKICGLENFIKSHPYDLSGGEQQRAAIAKILLMKPKILLLDEPVKGLDTDSKHQIAKILRKITSFGAAVVMVSHDMEFCAEYSDRCTLFFNGNLTGTSKTRDFFSDNAFYTTSAKRMSSGIIDNAVTCKDVLYALGRDVEDYNNKDDDYKNYKEFFRGNSEINKNKNILKNKKNIWHKINMSASVILFLISVLMVTDVFKVPYITENKVFSSVFMMVSAAAVMFLNAAYNKNKNNEIHIKPVKRSKKLSAAIWLIMIVFIPATIIIGVYFFNDAKYLFISILIMLECMLPFFIRFEKRKLQTREIVIIAMMCALCVMGRAAFYMLPEFKPITALVIISGAAFGGETGFLIGAVSMLTSNIIFGQGSWTPYQMFAMGIIGFISGFIYEKDIIPKNKISFAVYGFFASLLIYGGIMNPATMLMSRIEINKNSLIACFSAGFPVDTVHAVSTAFFLYIGAEQTIKILERVKLKYGLVR